MEKAYFTFRISDAMRRKVKFIAAKESRSMNSQLEHFVAKAVEQYEIEHGPIVLLDEEEPERS